MKYLTGAYSLPAARSDSTNSWYPSLAACSHWSQTLFNALISSVGPLAAWNTMSMILDWNVKGKIMFGYSYYEG